MTEQIEVSRPVDGMVIVIFELWWAIGSGTPQNCLCRRHELRALPPTGTQVQLQATPGGAGEAIYADIEKIVWDDEYPDVFCARLELIEINDQQSVEFVAEMRELGWQQTDWWELTR